MRVGLLLVRTPPLLYEFSILLYAGVSCFQVLVEVLDVSSTLFDLGDQLVLVLQELLALSILLML